MSVSRRTFLVAGQTLLAAAALPMKFFGAAEISALVGSGAAGMASWTRATFQPLINNSFGVQSGPVANAWLTLLSVQDMNPKTVLKTAPLTLGLRTLQPGPTSIDTFALHFYGTGEALPQGTYDLEHPKLGKFSLFIVPAGPSKYTAVISHLQSATSIVAPRPPLKPMAQAGAQAER
jgi:hypothetical protein